MSQSIENILSSPDKKKETEYNIITNMSTDINKWYSSLRNTIVWWWNKNTKTTKKTILNKNQITIGWEEREKTRSENRK
jgi:hypothetical protein